MVLDHTYTHPAGSNPSAQANPNGLSSAVLYQSISAILRNADLGSISAKKVRQQLEAQFNTSLKDRKSEIDSIIMRCLETESLAARQQQQHAQYPQPPATTAVPGGGALALPQNPAMTTTTTIATAHSPPAALTKVRGKAPTKKPSKKKKELDPNRPKRSTGLTVPMLLSDQLGAVLGVEKMSRCDVVRGLWNYIKSNDLQDAEDRRLKAVFGKTRLSGFEMNKYLSGHMQKISADDQ
ncbi:MAG: SWIB/MDM2 domain-containing protein [Piptocephalis tieghemiana]|nr:MAG: SWIB/MDM2 domain-containing protein [Piptocephalis tieghemiana]